MSEAKPPPNPLPCGCVARGWRDWENAVDDGSALHVWFKGVHVHHCPLHAAAPELLAALSESLDLLTSAEADGWKCRGKAQAIRQIRAALAKART